ncbi:MAG: hypothetical protein HAW63_05085 [Bdellovibrionaceae bacterium]|nr:hypothetical protein [Pseudobdellovibrionaceae bacterium]
MNRTKDPLLLLASLSWHNIHLKPANFLTLLKKYKKYQFSIADTWKYLPSHLQERLKVKPHWWKDSIEQLTWSIKQNIQFTYPGHHHYPCSLIRDLNYSPLLSYIGKPLNQETSPLLAVVGSRKPSIDSLNWMDATLGPVIKQNHINCISGGAQGIDQHSHQISIRNNTPTIAVIPTGFKNIYPHSFQSYIKAIEKSGGSIVSLFSPNMPLFKYNFHKRNWLIASLSTHVLMIVGQKKSGSLLTASLGLQLNKEVGTIPQAPWSVFSGNIELIKQGSQILSTKDDLSTWLKFSSH